MATTSEPKIGGIIIVAITEESESVRYQWEKIIAFETR